MKRLIIHIGTHKTATTGFQRICFRFKKLLRNYNIDYPTLKDFPGLNNHAPVAWMLDQPNNQKWQKYLDELLENSLKLNCSTILLSSEDFENILVNHGILKNIMRVAEAQGITNIELVLTTRKPIEYLDSIYTQLSQHGAILDYHEIAKSSARSGYFMHSSQHYNYCFAIKALELSRNLSESFPNIKIHHFSFDEFLQKYPGRRLFADVLSVEIAEKIESFDLNKLEVLRANKSINQIQTEINYAYNTLGANIHDIKNIIHKSLILSIAQQRIAHTSEGRSLAKELLKD